MASGFRFFSKPVLYTVALALLPVAGSSLVSHAVIVNEEALQRATSGFWVLFFAGSAFTMAFALTPTTFVALLGGFLLGWAALPPLCVSYLLAAGLGYAVAARLDSSGRLLAFLRQKPVVDRVVGRLQGGSTMAVMLARLSPVLPFAVMNAVFALVRIPLWPFLWGSLWGMLPRTMLSVWAGTQARQLRALLENSNGGGAWQLALLGLTLLSLAGLGYLLRRWSKS